MDNNASICMSNALSAAVQINIAMCLFPEGHAAQVNLNRAMQNALIIAEQCRQVHAQPTTPEAATR